MGISITDIFGGSVVQGVSDLVGKFKTTPDKKLEFQTLIEQNSALFDQKELELQAKIVDAEAAEVASINATMQSEAKSEHWMQWAWRPVVGFTFAGVIVNNYILYPYLAKYGMVLVSVPDGVWNSMLVVLGAAAATRGLEKWQKEKNNI